MMATLTRLSPPFPTDLAAIYGKYRPKIESYICRRISDPTVTEDLTAQVFLKVLEATKTGKGARQHFNGWIFRIAHNLVIDHYRARERRRDVPLEDAHHLHSEPDSTVQIAARSLRQEALERAMRRLTDDQAKVIQMRLAGYDFVEIANTMGKTVGAIKALQHRGVYGLHQLLAGNCDGWHEGRES